MVCLCSLHAHSQLQFSKLIGKDSQKYGVGAGLFVYLDIPTASENQKFRIELFEFGYHPTKGDGYFTAEEGKGFFSFRLGYKYVFSETESGFYILPTAGAANVMVITREETEAKNKWGFTSALETGYSLSVGERDNQISLGIKYEQAFIKNPYNLQAIGLRLAYSTHLFSRRY